MLCRDAARRCKAVLCLTKALMACPRGKELPLSERSVIILWAVVDRVRRGGRIRVRVKGQLSWPILPLAMAGSWAWMQCCYFIF